MFPRMAKKETTIIVALRCDVCKNKNYTVFKNKDNRDKLVQMKHCPFCRKHTKHDEAKIK